MKGFPVVGRPTEIIQTAFDCTRPQPTSPSLNGPGYKNRHLLYANYYRSSGRTRIDSPSEVASAIVSSLNNSRSEGIRQISIHPKEHIKRLDGSGYLEIDGLRWPAVFVSPCPHQTKNPEELQSNRKFQSGPGKSLNAYEYSEYRRF